MPFSRRKFIQITTIVCAGCSFPCLTSGGVEHTGLLTEPECTSTGLLHKNLTDIHELPTARACLVCGNSIELVGGHKLIHTKFRGTELVSGCHQRFREDLRVRTRLVEEPELFFIAWGEEQFMTQQIIDRARSSYLQGYQPWFCQKCGKRTCQLCGTPLRCLAYGDYAFDDGGRGYYSKGANLGACPPCTNPKCKKYRNWGDESEHIGGESS